MGASLKPVESARQAAKPASDRRFTGDSAPPATMMSASPSAISREASPMACAPVEQAVTTEWFGPLRPWAMETCPEAMIDDAAGDEERRDPTRPLLDGASRRHRRCRRCRRCPNRSARPRRTGPRRRSDANPASSNAWPAAAMANTMNGSTLRCSFGLHPGGRDRSCRRSRRRGGPDRRCGRRGRRSAESGDRGGSAAVPGDQPAPGVLDPAAQRRDHTETRNHHPTHRAIPNPSLLMGERSRRVGTFPPRRRRVDL